MEIRNNGVGKSGSDQIDLTRTNRDALRERVNAPPTNPRPATADSAAASPSDVGTHRDRLAQAESLHKRIHGARERFAKSVHKRIAGARERFAAEQVKKDEVSVSSRAQELADTTIAQRPQDVDAAARTQRVNDLRSQHEQGKLDVESMVAEAAYRMLGGK